MTFRDVVPRELWFPSRKPVLPCSTSPPSSVCNLQWVTRPRSLALTYCWYTLTRMTPIPQIPWAWCLDIGCLLVAETQIKTVTMSEGGEERDTTERRIWLEWRQTSVLWPKTCLFVWAWATLSSESDLGITLNSLCCFWAIWVHWYLGVMQEVEGRSTWTACDAASPWAELGGGVDFGPPSSVPLPCKSAISCCGAVSPDAGEEQAGAVLGLWNSKAARLSSF